MPDGSAEFRQELEAQGLEKREARWLVDEFAPGGDPNGAVALRAAARRRIAGEPLQYILGHWPFRGLDLDVDSRVLIPRPETEQLVDVALDELARSDVRTPTIVDLGCGSGAIGLALVIELAQRGVVATLIGVDNSPDVLDVARANAVKHHALTASFVRSNWFDAVDPSLRGRIDLVVANPPYVGRDELALLDPVLAYEPASALVANDTDAGVGTADLVSVITQASNWLNAWGVLVSEHGDSQGAACRTVASQAGFADVRTEQDLAGRDRMIVARRHP